MTDPLTRVARYAAAVVSGVALSFAFPEPDIAPLAWVMLVPLLLIVRSQHGRAAFAAGWFFGVGFFGSLVVWVSLVGWVAWLVLVAVQAVFTALVALAWAWLGVRSSRVERFLYLPAAWVAAEFLRSLTPVGGFSWGQLAQSQTPLAWLLRPASVGGAWLVAFLIVVVNVALAEAVTEWRAQRRRVAVGSVSVAVVVLVVPLALPANSATGEVARVAIAQGSVPPETGSDPFARELAIVNNHVDVTQSLVGEDLDLVVWPESALGVDIDRTPVVAAAVARAARSVDAPMVVGGNLDAGPRRYLVMAFEVSPEGEVVDRYQKTHLVPFGEYVPARGLFGWLPILEQVPRDAIPGKEDTLFDIPGLPAKVAPVISFEGDFGSLVRKRIAAGGRLLIVATNTSTWGFSWASAQHLAMSQVRAAENGVWVVHAAITGISAFVRPDGSVVESTDLWEKSALVGEVGFPYAVTLYARFGDWVPYLCLLVVVAGALVSARRERTGTVPA